VRPLPDLREFVTTPAYAPRLRARRRVEQALATEAAGRGWDREVERHHCTANRIAKLLTDPDQPLDRAEDTLADERIDQDGEENR
jgi:hypothetical protein